MDNSGPLSSPKATIPFSEKSRTNREHQFPDFIHALPIEEGILASQNPHLFNEVTPSGKKGVSGLTPFSVLSLRTRA